MTAESDAERPNEYGFAGEATAPEPEAATEDQPRGETRPSDREAGDRIAPVDGERIAVPSGDLTGAITNALDDSVERRGADDVADEDRDR